MLMDSDLYKVIMERIVFRNFPFSNTKLLGLFAGYSTIHAFTIYRFANGKKKRIKVLLNSQVWAESW